MAASNQSSTMRPGTNKPGPGRPVGSLTRVLRADAGLTNRQSAGLHGHSDGALGLHHFAFLRAQLHGVEIDAAWERYMGHQDERADRRVIRRFTRELFERVLERERG